MSGASIGMAVTTFFGTVWLLAWTAFSGRAIWKIPVILVGAAALVLGCSHIAPLREASINAGTHAPDGKSFYLVVAIEAFAIFIFASLLARRGRRDLIIPLVAVVVGLHFIPLAPIFGAPIYYLAALGMTVSGLAGFLLEGADRRRAVTCLGCGLTLWTCSVVLYFSA